MKRHILYSLLALVISGCTLLDGEPNFSLVSDPECTPENISDWEAYTFIFSEGKCTEISKYSQLSDCKTIDASDGDVVSVVAIENEGNAGFSCMTTGKEASEYMVVTKDMSPVVPRIWGTVFTVSENQTIFREVMKPVTSEISISVKNAPETFNNATLSLDDFSNAWQIYSDSYCSEKIYRAVEIVTEGEEVKAAILPGTESKGKWKPKLVISLGNEKLRSQAELDWSMTLRGKIDITIDFSKYVSKGTVDIEYIHRNILTPSKTRTIKETLKSSYAPQKPDNLHYMVQTQLSEGWNNEKVYDALCSDANKHSYIWNDWGNSRKMRDTMSYCLIDTKFPAKIRVSKLSGNFTKAEVRPSTYGIQVTDCSDGTIEFTLPSAKMGKVSVEFDGDRQHNLFIYAREPDASKPSAGSSNVIYYGKGEHNPGTIRLNSGQTLYIDHGAKVYANVKTNGSNITIAGHGILSGEKMAHHGDNLYSWGDFLISCNENKSSVSNLKIKDITMIDSPGWNLIIPKTDGVTIDGVNMISWELNGDGIDIVSSRNVEIKNCFLRTYDDCITLKCRFIVSPISDVTNVNIHDCLIWADYARGIVIGPEAGNTQSQNPGRIHGVTVSNCTFLQHKRGLDDDLRAAFAIGQGSDGSTDLWRGSNPPRTISDITASGLVFDNIDKSGRHTAIWQYGNSPVVMENVRLSDFTIIDNKGNNYPALAIKTNGSRINGLKISNFKVNSTKLTSSMVNIDNRNNVSMTIE